MNVARIQEELIREYGKTTVALFLFAIALLIAGIYSLIERYFRQRSFRRLEELKECGAMPFIMEVLFFKDTIEVIDDAQKKGVGLERALANARKFQAATRRFKARTVTGTVCGEHISAEVESGELDLFVQHPETKRAIEEAFRWFSKHCQTYDFDLGIRINIELSTIPSTNDH